MHLGLNIFVIVAEQMPATPEQCHIRKVQIRQCEERFEEGKRGFGRADDHNASAVGGGDWRKMQKSIICVSEIKINI
jgi:hypothetical protein